MQQVTNEVSFLLPRSLSRYRKREVPHLITNLTSCMKILLGLIVIKPELWLPILCTTRQFFHHGPLCSFPQLVPSPFFSIYLLKCLRTWLLRLTTRSPPWSPLPHPLKWSLSESCQTPPKDVPVPLLLAVDTAATWVSHRHFFRIADRLEMMVAWWRMREVGGARWRVGEESRTSL